jgi:pentatricopeptide repeat protein
MYNGNNNYVMRRMRVSYRRLKGAAGRGRLESNGAKDSVTCYVIGGSLDVRELKHCAWNRGRRRTRAAAPDEPPRTWRSTMLGSFVCRQCRARLTRRIVPVRSPQWQPRATFFSLRKTAGQPQQQGDEAAAEDPSQQEEIAAETQDPQRSRYADNTQHAQPQGRGGRYSRLVEDDVDAPASEPQFNDEMAADEAIRGPAAELQRYLDLKMHVGGKADNIWAQFEETYTSRDCEALTQPRESDIPHLAGGRVFEGILREINGAFCFARVKPVITPTAALFKFEQLGIATSDQWIRQTLAYMTHQAILAVNAPPEDESRDLPMILFELVSLWRLFFQCRGRQVQLDHLSRDWNLPAPEDMPNRFDSQIFSMRLQDYHPGLMGNATLGFCAAYFYTLSTALSTVEPLHQEAEPFIQFLSRILTGARMGAVLNYTKKSTRFLLLPENVQKEIAREIANAPRKAMNELVSSGAILESAATGDPSENREVFHLKKIARAVQSNKSPVVLQTLWEAAIKEFRENGKPAIPHSIYNAVLSGFLVLKQPSRSVDVWNHMIAHGLKPNMRTWVALLHGCEKARDLDGFNGMWTRMLNTGIEPDAYAWTARVHGLIFLRKVDAALAALDDLGNRWLAAENATRNPPRKTKGAKKLQSSVKATNKCTKPNIEIINGAITAIVQQPANRMYHGKRVTYVQKILGWAGSFDIKPNAITYNSLIQLYLSASDFSTAFKVLRQMEQAGIQADMATHTMLVNISFENLTFDGLTEAEQTKKIITLLDDLEAGGLKLNDYVYSISIDRLLKQYSNYTAVGQIIEHMHARSMVPSAHAYTSLITFYFQQDPPAMPAVDSLVHHFFTSDRVPKDRVMFDRLLEGYGRHGEVGKMMSVLTRMSKQKTVPGWDALIVVIEALVRDGDYDRARDIVRDVERGQGIGEGGVISGQRDGKDFFYVADKLGVGIEDAQMGDFMDGADLRLNSDEKASLEQAEQRGEVQDHIESPGR